MHKILLFLLVLCQCLLCKPKMVSEIELIRVDSSSYNRILKLRMQKIEPPLKQSDMVVVECQGFALGQILPSKFSEYNVRQSKDGSRLMVFVFFKNNKHRFYINRRDGLSIAEQKSYRKRVYSKRIVQNIPGALQKGPVALLVVPVTSYNEILKSPDAHPLAFTSVKTNKGGDGFYKQFSMPLVVYNQPTGTYVKGSGILIDFYLLNCSLSRYYGHTLVAEVKNLKSGKVVLKTTLNHWSPYLLKNLPKGHYSLDLALLYKGRRLQSPQAIRSSGKFTVK